MISINSIFSAFFAIELNGFTKKFSKSSPTQNIISASWSIFACEGFIAKPCGEAYPSTIKSGFPTPSIKELAKEWIGLIDATTFTSAFTDVKNVKNVIIVRKKGIFFK